LPEVQRLFAEGRAQLGAAAARDAVDMASAVVRLGVARGISAFQRFGYIERNGQSNLAVPLGRFTVSERPAQHVACLDDLGDWMKRLRRAAREDGASRQLVMRERDLANSMFDLVRATGEPARWQTVLLSLAQVEAVMRHGAGFQAQPVPRLRPEWVAAADDGTAEFRLALSLALQASDFEPRRGHPVDPVRRHWLPLDAKQPGRFAVGGDQMHPRLQPDPGVVMQGREGLADAIALLERRLVEAAQRGQRELPLRGARKSWTHPADLAAWLAGRVDTDRTLSLACALMALDGRAWAESPITPSSPAAKGDMPDDAFLVIRLAHLTGALQDGQRIPCDAAILRRLASGDAATAVALAVRRLHSVGLRCTVSAAAATHGTARLWGAALAFPIHPQTAQDFARRIDPTFAEELS
jgi:CRISPR-associated protein Csx17